MRPALLLAAALLGALAPRALDAAASQPPLAKESIAEESVAEESVAGEYPQRLLTRDQALADIALMRRGLETIHPGLYRYRSKVEIDAAFARLEAVASGPISDLQFWRAVALMLAEIHCDHTKPEVSDALDRYRNTHPTHLPLRFAFVEGRMIVVSNDGQPGAPPTGSEVTAINDVPIPRIVAALGRAVAYDGATVDAIVAKLSADSDLMGDDFNEYWPAFYGFPERWRLTFEAPGDTRLTRATLAPVSFKTWTALPWPSGAYRDDFYKALTWRVAGKAAYLRLDTFVNYRNPVDADAFLDGFFKILAKDHVDRLILDLRNNSGGSDDVSVALGRYLLPSAFILVEAGPAEGGAVWRPRRPHGDVGRSRGPVRPADGSVSPHRRRLVGTPAAPGGRRRRERASPGHFTRPIRRTGHGADRPPQWFGRHHDHRPAQGQDRRAPGWRGHLGQRRRADGRPHLSSSPCPIRG